MFLSSNCLRSDWHSKMTRTKTKKCASKHKDFYGARDSKTQLFFGARFVRWFSKKGILLPLACFVFFSQLHLRSLPKFIRDVVDLKMIFNLDALGGKIISQNTFSCILIIWQKKGYKNFLKNIFLDKIYISVFFFFLNFYVWTKLMNNRTSIYQEQLIQKVYHPKRILAY